MPSGKGRSILQCIHQYADSTPKRHKVQLSHPDQVPCETCLTDRPVTESNNNCQKKPPKSDQAFKLSRQAGQQHSQVTAKNFYGKNRELLIDQRVARLRANVQQRLQSKALAPFEQFSLQKQAFTWAAAHERAADLRTFSVEHNFSGKRSFLVSSYDGFWKRYQDMLPHHRHYYEIIQESYPCHLYFDLEFKTEYNHAVDGEGLIDKLLELVARQLQVMFSIDFEPAWVLELESDAQDKFSRHVIIQIPGKAFANNLHAGHFVREVCKAAIHPETGVSSLQVAKEDGSTLVVDTGVYTRNRAFRLYLSSKAGKSAVLTPTGRFPNKAFSQKQIFQRSLICNISPEAHLLRCYDEGTQSQQHGRQRPQLSHQNAANMQGSFGPSPCPEIDAFITSISTQGGVQGSVRSWVLWEDIGAILFNIKDNRWCGNIGRAHKSNGVYIIADLQGGVWFQRCYDPDCREYRSETMPLPPELTRSCLAAGFCTVDSSNSIGVLKDDDDTAEAAMLAILEQYESTAERNTSS